MDAWIEEGSRVPSASCTGTRLAPNGNTTCRNRPNDCFQLCWTSENTGSEDLVFLEMFKTGI